ENSRDKHEDRQQKVAAAWFQKRSGGRKYRGGEQKNSYSGNSRAPDLHCLHEKHRKRQGCSGDIDIDERKLKKSFRSLEEERVTSGLGDDERGGQRSESDGREKNPMRNVLLLRRIGHNFKAI